MANTDMLNKKQFKALKDKLSPKNKSVWEEADEKQRKEIFTFSEYYKNFLNAGKTERMAVEYILERAENAGFKPLSSAKRGDRFYAQLQGKAVILAVMGSQPLSEGVRLIGAHSDVPRLDLKMKPLYENQDLVFLKTHYYGGLKKYQWFARPLALHGVVCTKDGATAQIHVGDHPEDPVFTILDLLPHLSRKSQENKKLSEAFEAERMNVLLGSLPLDTQEEEKDRAKMAILNLLHKRYGIIESDLISAELEVVPAGLARDVGLDRSMVGAYGQDDRLCVYCALEAIMRIKKPRMTAVTFFADKEEIGSEGPTSASSRWLESIIARLLEIKGEDPSYRFVMQTLSRSEALSADVNAAFDPDYPEVHEKLNAGYMGYGVNLTKYTGHGGKYGANDAGAEYMAWIRRVLDQAGVIWQAAGMGKIDEGGGGTIAKLLSVYGMDVVDMGPALLSMHSPFEIGHKADIYTAMLAYQAFLEAAPRK